MAKEMTFRGKAIVVRQLTAAEVADYLDHAEGLTMTVADMLMDRQIPAQVVATACGLTVAELNGDVLPSELNDLWDAVEAENPFFCRLMERLAATAKKMAGMERGAAAPSEKPPASLPETAMAPA